MDLVYIAVAALFFAAVDWMTSRGFDRLKEGPR